MALMIVSSAKAKYPYTHSYSFAYDILHFLLNFFPWTSTCDVRVMKREPVRTNRLAWNLSEWFSREGWHDGSGHWLSRSGGNPYLTGVFCKKLKDLNIVIKANIVTTMMSITRALAVNHIYNRWWIAFYDDMSIPFVLLFLMYEVNVRLFIFKCRVSAYCFDAFWCNFFFRFWQECYMLCEDAIWDHIFFFFNF